MCYDTPMKTKPTPSELHWEELAAMARDYLTVHRIDKDTIIKTIEYQPKTNPHGHGMRGK